MIKAYEEILRKIRELGGAVVCDREHVVAIDLGRTSITDEMLAAIATLTDLDTVDLTGTSITDAGLAAFATHCLQSISVQETAVTGLGLRHLKLCLRSLNMGGCGAIDDDSLEVVAGFALLRKLWVNKTAITDRGLAKLGALTHLQFLAIDDTAVTDAGLLSLTPLCNLTSLSCLNTRITAHGFEKLRMSLPKLSRGLVL